MARPDVNPDIGAYQTAGGGGDFEMAGDESADAARSSLSGSNDSFDADSTNQAIYVTAAERDARRAMLLFGGGYG